MEIEEKERKILNLILEYTKTYAPNNEGYFGILLKDFFEKGLDRTDIRLSLTRLKGGDIIKELYHCWGFTEKEKGEKKFYFTVTSRSEPIFPDDLEGENEEEAYCIAIDERNLTAALKGKSIKKRDEIIVLYLDSEGYLYRESRDKFCYQLLKNGEPLKIILHFIRNPNTNYGKSTKEIALDLEKDSQYLRTDIGKINRKASIRLGLKKERLIQGIQKSGYRLNPKIKIVTKK